jgi:hypothetical protein
MEMLGSQPKRVGDHDEEVTIPRPNPARPVVVQTNAEHSTSGLRREAHLSMAVADHRGFAVTHPADYHIPFRLRREQCRHGPGWPNG